MPGTAAPRASSIAILAVLGGAVLMIGGLVSQRTGTAIAGGVIAGVGVASYPWGQEAKRMLGIDGFASGYGTYG